MINVDTESFVSSAWNSFQLSLGNSTVSLFCRDQNIVGFGLPLTPHSNTALLPAVTCVSAGLWAINGTAETERKNGYTMCDENNNCR